MPFKYNPFTGKLDLVNPPTTLSGTLTDHNELNNLDYASAGHTGFAQSSHTHTESDVTDLDKYTQAEVDGKWVTWSGTIDHDTIQNTHNLTTDIDHDQLTNYSADEHFTKASINHSDITDDEATKHRLINDSASGATDLWSAQKINSEISGVEGTTTFSGLTDTPSDYDNGKYAKSTIVGLEWDNPVDGYATETYVDNADTTLSGNLQANINSKSGIGHIHTESDITDLDHDAQKIKGKSVDAPVVGDDGYYLSYDHGNSKFTLVSGTGDGGVSNHNALNNLDYASAGHTGFASEALLTTVSGDLQTNIDGKSDTNHTHDDRYYTETEADTLHTTLSGNLQTNIDGKSDIGHTHNDIYYTETELNNGQLDTRYYTETEADSLHTTLSGNLQNNIDGKSPTGHNHDDIYYTETELNNGQLDTRYYTEAEIDIELTTLSGNLQTNIDGKDNYSSWSFAIDGETKDAITSSDILDFVGGDNITITRSADDQITISGSGASTLLELIDTPGSYDDGKYLKSTVAGTEWATISGADGLSNVVEDTTPQLGGDLDVNGKSMDWGTIITSNGTYKGETLTVVVDDAATVFGNGLYCAGDFHYERTDADAASTMPCRGLALESGSGSKKILLWGQICNTSWSWSAGDVYVSCTTGELTQTTVSGTGDQVQIVGFAISANTMFFRPLIDAQYEA